MVLRIERSANSGLVGLAQGQFAVNAGQGETQVRFSSDQLVTHSFVEAHITIGIEALKLIRRHGKSVKHLRFDE